MRTCKKVCGSVLIISAVARGELSAGAGERCTSNGLCLKGLQGIANFSRAPLKNLSSPPNKNRVLAEPVPKPLLKDISALIEEEFEKCEIPSLQVVIGNKDNIIYEKAFGFCDLENEVSASPKSTYGHTSIAGYFTATSAMIPVESGLLEVNKPIRTYYPKAPQSSGLSPLGIYNAHTTDIRMHIYSQNVLYPLQQSQIDSILSSYDKS